MVPLKDKNMMMRTYVLIMLRVLVKLMIVFAAVLLHASIPSLLILLGIIFLSELYKNVASLLISRGANPRLIGAFVSALDGAALTCALFFANALNTDLYLFVLFSIAINTAEYGLLSAMTEGIIAGFSYAIFLLASLPSYDSSLFFTTYFIRILILVFLSWITGWLANELYEKEGKLNIVLENDVHEEELNELKDTFVTDAAESIKTPMSAIKGYIDLMLHGRVGDLDERVTEYINNILTNVLKVDSIVEELLHIIEIEDTIKLRRKVVSVNEFVATLKEDAAAFSKLFKCEIGFQDETAKGEQVRIDEYRLKIAIKNILFYLFNISGQKIQMSFKHIDDNLCIEVTAEVKKYANLEIFSNEYVFENKMNKNSMLKVYTSKLIIESHEGRIELKKDHDDVIHFMIYIPYQKN